jgi:tetratricopeptide (TPR) repeat protein
MLDEQRPRRVVPRWRSSWITAQTAEARAAKPGGVSNLTAEVSNKQMELDLSPTVPVAAELMFLATEAGNEYAAKRGAALIVENQQRIGATRLVATAKRVLESASMGTAPDAANDFVKESRKLLALDFRNPVLLMDIARDLTARGHDKAALRYVRAAVALAPQSRFVVRAAARYFLHIGDHGRAHEVLLRSSLLISDPWVQASEIAVSTVRGRTSPNARRAIRALSNMRTIGLELSELASAVATVELNDGSDKKARHLFAKSLERPNDNSVAQAEWAAQRLKLVVDAAALRTPFSFEANSNNAYRRLQMLDAIAFAKEWAEDEPFASRPLDALTHMYCLEERFDEARQSAEHAIRLEGKDTGSSQLNLLFIRIEQGDIEGAHEDLLRLAKRAESRPYAVHIYADAGALAYATGDFKQGQFYYQKAIKLARAKGAVSEEALARAFFARAATRHGDPNAENVVRDTAAAVERLPSAGAIHIVRRLVDSDQSRMLEQVAAKRIAQKKWTWDSVTNTLQALE